MRLYVMKPFKCHAAAIEALRIRVIHVTVDCIKAF